MKRTEKNKKSKTSNRRMFDGFGMNGYAFSIFAGFIFHPTRKFVLLTHKNRNFRCYFRRVTVTFNSVDEKTRRVKGETVAYC